MWAEDLLMLEPLFECPQCREWHVEPASATLGLRVLCLDCDLDVRVREATESAFVLTIEPIPRAA
jgi:hypothetical protein